MAAACIFSLPFSPPLPSFSPLKHFLPPSPSSLPPPPYRRLFSKYCCTLRWCWRSRSTLESVFWLPWPYVYFMSRYIAEIRDLTDVWTKGPAPPTWTRTPLGIGNHNGVRDRHSIGYKGAKMRPAEKDAVTIRPIKETRDGTTPKYVLDLKLSEPTAPCVK